MLTSPTYIKGLLKKHDFKIKKNLGQNFLTDKNTVNKIVDAANIDKNDLVIEIGPGLGTMTRELAQRAKQVVTIELDKKLLPILEETLADYKNVQIINQDALKVNFDQISNSSQDGKYKIVANLPYYVTTPIVMYLLESRFQISTIIVMVQKEVAQRMVAKPGGKEYGALSVAVQFYTRPEIVAKVPPTVFHPRPEVESAVVRMQILDQPIVDINDQAKFFKVVRAAFGQRRKTLLNAISNFGFNKSKDEIEKILNQCSIDPKRRGETLSLEEFAHLSRLLE